MNLVDEEQLRAAQSQKINRAFSESKDPKIAARELFAGLQGADLACVVFFCCTQYDLTALSLELETLFGDTQVVGCTTAGEITPLGYQGGTITGFSLPNSQFSVKTCLIKELASFSVDQVKGKIGQLVDTVKECSIAPFESHSFAISLLDGLSIKQEEILQAIDSSLGEIPLVGGSAGDDLLFHDTHVYCRGEFYSNAAVIIIVNTALPFKVMSDHHLIGQTEKLIITSADPLKRTVHELNAEPAALEYCRVTGLCREDLRSEKFALNPLAVQFGDQTFIRAIQKVNDDNSLTFFCAVDVGVVLTKMKSPGIAQHARVMLNEATKSIGEIQLVIAYDCIHRRMEVEADGSDDEVSKIYVQNNFIGFNSYGEQYKDKHINHTLSCVAIGYMAD